MIKVSMLKASYGDSILVSFSQNKKTENILIDCGFAETFNDQISKAITSLKGQDKNASFERLIITHLDRDHINGAVALLKKNESQHKHSVIPIKQIWHNTLRHMQSAKRKANEDKLNIASENTVPLTKLESTKLENFILGKQEADIIQAEPGETTISASTSAELGSLILHGKYPWNTDFDKKAIVIEEKQFVQISANIAIRLLTPNRKRLEDVESMFRKSLLPLGIDPEKTDKLIDDAFEVYIRNKDFAPHLGIEESIAKKSPYKKLNIQQIIDLAHPKHYQPDHAAPNGSSISFIAYINGKKLLFLADCFAEDALEELEKIEDHDLYFDLIKISHHGAKKNTSPALLKLIDSERFLISTNGAHPRHLHPDAETIARIITRPLLPGKKERVIYCNYATDTSKLFDDSVLKSHFQYDLKIEGEIDL